MCVWGGGCGGCVCSTLLLMWQAAGSESRMAPHVLKTILLILKGKPGEMQDSLMERRRFSLDTTNMMPVAVSNTMSVSLSWCFSDHENPYLPTESVIFLDTVLLSSIHSYCFHSFILIECLLYAIP